MATSTDIATLQRNDAVVSQLVTEYKTISTSIDANAGINAAYTAKRNIILDNIAAIDATLATKNADLLTRMAQIIEDNRDTLTPEQIALLQYSDATVYTLSVEIKTLMDSKEVLNTSLTAATVMLDDVIAVGIDLGNQLSAKGAEIVARMAQIIAENVV